MHNIYFFTDIHGCWDLYNGILSYCFNEDPESTIIFGGDACDRGLDGYDIMLDLLNNPKIIYLKGNHEDIFVKAAREIIGYCASSDEKYNLLHHCSYNQAQDLIKEIIIEKRSKTNLAVINGGAATLLKWILAGADEDFVDKIDSLPLTFSYEKLDFCHAGDIYEDFQAVATAEYNKMPINIFDKESLLWDRDNFTVAWETDRICVHGHTPTPYLPKQCYNLPNENETFPAAWIGIRDFENKHGWKIDMDTGAFYTGRTFLLDCLALNVIGFIDKDIKEQNKEKHQINIFTKYKIISENL